MCTITGYIGVYYHWIYWCVLSLDILVCTITVPGAEVQHPVQQKGVTHKLMFLLHHFLLLVTSLPFSACFSSSFSTGDQHLHNLLASICHHYHFNKSSLTAGDQCVQGGIRCLPITCTSRSQQLPGGVHGVTVWSIARILLTLCRRPILLYVRVPSVKRNSAVLTKLHVEHS